MSDYRDYLATLGLSGPVALEGFLEAAPDALVVVDWAGNIVIVNHLAEGLFGYSREELLGMPIEQLVPQRFREHHGGYRNDYFREPRTRPMGEGRELSGRRKPRRSGSAMKRRPSCGNGSSQSWGTTCVNRWRRSTYGSRF